MQTWKDADDLAEDFAESYGLDVDQQGDLAIRIGGFVEDETATLRARVAELEQAITAMREILKDAAELLKEIDEEMYKRGMVGYGRDRRFIAVRSEAEKGGDTH